MVNYADSDYPRKRLKLWDKSEVTLVSGSMEDFNSETDSDYTSYWRDWVSQMLLFLLFLFLFIDTYAVLLYVVTVFDSCEDVTTRLWLLLLKLRWSMRRALVEYEEHSF